MTIAKRAAGGLALAAFLAVSGCASPRYGRMSAPDGSRAFGLEFGADRAATERALAAAGIATRAAPGDQDALLAQRCPSAPVEAPCRLLFGPQGLYAAQIEVPAREAGSLESSVAKELGAPDRLASEQAAAADGLSSLVAGWDRPGWTISIATTGPAQPALAILRVEHDASAPPVVAGVSLGGLREDVERALDQQGATVVQRDAGATTYVGCPQGDGGAMACVVTFHGGRAAAVTEVHPVPPEDSAALAEWRLLAERYERDIGRRPSLYCPDDGPDRVEGDCTATWSSVRLTVVVGAHRNAGASHRGAISVYTAFTYPPLAAVAGEQLAGEQGEAQ
jgi:hypothetical protein